MQDNNRNRIYFMESKTLKGNSGMLSGKNRGGVQIGAGLTTLLSTVVKVGYQEENGKIRISSLDLIA